MRIPVFIILYFVCGYFPGFSQIDTVDFLSVDVVLDINFQEKKVSGEASYNFKVLKPADSIFLDAKNMQLAQSSDLLSGFKLVATDEKIWIYNSFIPDREYTIKFSYHTFPKQALYFFGNQVWTQGQGKYTSHWLPSIDNVNDKIVFNISAIANTESTVLSNGVLTKKQALGNDRQVWHYQMQQPMSSYLAALVIGDLEKSLLYSSAGTPIELYISPEDVDKLEPTYRHTVAIFDFLEKEIGVPYPWQVYKQVPVRDFLYGGMENTTLTIFSSSYVVDEIGFNDKNYINVNAHELAHHWFGNLVTASSDEHHWLQEGFATYYALLAEREIFGEDYFYYKLIDSAFELIEQNENNTGEVLLSKGASSLTYYKKGAWALFALHSAIGDIAFKNSVKNYLEKHKFSNVTTEDFLQEAEFFSNQNLDWFRKEWLLNPSFPQEKFQKLCMRNSSLFRRLFEFEKATYQRPFSEKKNVFDKVFQQPLDRYMVDQAFNQLSEYNFTQVEKYYKSALQSEDVFIRRSVSEQVEIVPESLKEDYETLLDDSSYTTVLNALINLYMSFPEEQNKYLKKTETVVGLQNKNVRMMWLVLNMIADGISEEDFISSFEELAGYTSKEYSFEIRQEAFTHLYLISDYNVQNFIDLVDACLHPNWRFASFSREMLSDLLTEPSYREIFIQILPELSPHERDWLQSQLDK